MVRVHGPGFTLLRVLAAVLSPSYRMRYNVLDWMMDLPFKRYLHAVDEAGAIKSINAGRRWAIYQLLRLTDQVPGDTVECGVYRGATSYVMAAFISRSELPKSHHIFDSFGGLSAPTAKDGSVWQANDLQVEMDDTKRRLSKFPNLHFYKGWIPDRFEEVADKHFSFVHIDVDLYDPTRDSLAFFYPRTNGGGLIVCDDYGSSVCPGATKAVDEYLADRPEKMVMLTDGGGFLIKGVPTAPAYDPAG